MWVCARGVSVGLVFEDPKRGEAERPPENDEDQNEDEDNDDVDTGKQGRRRRRPRQGQR